MTKEKGEKISCLSPTPMNSKKITLNRHRCSVATKQPKPIDVQPVANRRVGGSEQKR